MNKFNYILYIYVYIITTLTLFIKKGVPNYVDDDDDGDGQIGDNIHFIIATIAIVR